MVSWSVIPPLLLLLLLCHASEIIYSKAKGNLSIAFSAFLPGPEECYYSKFGDLVLENATVVGVNDACEDVPDSPNDNAVLVSYLSKSCRDKEAAALLAQKGYQALIVLVSYYTSDDSTAKIARSLWFGCSAQKPIYYVSHTSVLLDYRDDDIRLNLQAAENPALDPKNNVSGIISCVVVCILLVLKAAFILVLVRLSIKSGWKWNMGAFVLFAELLTCIAGLILVGDYGLILALYPFGMYSIFLNGTALLSNVSTGLIALIYRDSLAKAKVIKHRPLVDASFYVLLITLTVFTILVTLGNGLYIKAPSEISLINVVLVIGFQCVFFTLFLFYKKRVTDIVKQAQKKGDANRILKQQSVPLKYSAYCGILLTICLLLSMLALVTFENFDMFSCSFQAAAYLNIISGLFQILALKIAKEFNPAVRFKKYLESRTPGLASSKSPSLGSGTL